MLISNSRNQPARPSLPQPPENCALTFPDVASAVKFLSRRIQSDPNRRQPPLADNFHYLWFSGEKSLSSSSSFSPTCDALALGNGFPMDDEVEEEEIGVTNRRCRLRFRLRACARHLSHFLPSDFLSLSHPSGWWWYGGRDVNADLPRRAKGSRWAAVIPLFLRAR